MLMNWRSDSAPCPDVNSCFVLSWCFGYKGDWKKNHPKHLLIPLKSVPAHFFTAFRSVSLCFHTYDIDLYFIPVFFSAGKTSTAITPTGLSREMTPSDSTLWTRSSISQVKQKKSPRHSPLAYLELDSWTRLLRMIKSMVYFLFRNLI